MTVCKGCGKSIVPFVEPRYTGREPEEHWHWDCHQKVRDRFDATRAEWPALVERAENALKRLRRAIQGVRDE